MSRSYDLEEVVVFSNNDNHEGTSAFANVDQEKSKKLSYRPIDLQQRQKYNFHRSSFGHSVGKYDITDRRFNKDPLMSSLYLAV